MSCHCAGTPVVMASVVSQSGSSLSLPFSGGGGGGSGEVLPPSARPSLQKTAKHRKKEGALSLFVNNSLFH